jgi:hypothetical protein
MLLNNGFPRRLQIVIQLIAATFLLLIPMFYNGCPLYYPDSMGYIFWGQLWQPVPERVSTYALFIRFFAAGRDLWFPVIVQTLIISYLLRRIWIQLTGKDPDGFFYAAFFCLGLLSPLGWTASTLMPDLFCVSSSLFLFLLLFPGEGKKPSWWHIAGFVFTASQHLSNLMVNGLLLGVFAVFYLIKGRFQPILPGLWMAFSGILITIITIGMAHKFLSGDFFLSKSGPAFLTGRIIETGIANRFLNQEPDLCPEFQKEKSAFPMSLESYLWNNNSPLKRLGGLHDSLDFHRKFNSEVFSRPWNLVLFLKAGIKSGVKQLFLLDTGDGLTMGSFDQLCFYPENQAEYKLSKQISGIDFEKLNLWTNACLVLLILTFIFNLRHFDQGNEPLMALGFFVLLLCLSNAFVNGSLATPLNRYQVRVFWLVYFWLLAASYPVFKSNFPPNRNKII